MSWRDAISEGFPSPDEREPANLRGDIIDELADHLACAMNRELRRTDNTAAAERAVLERFGNPKAIVRQLWWAAMKERIMKDRAFTVVFVLASLALIAAFVVPWATQQQKVNEAVLEQLQALAANIKPYDKPPVLENWSRLTVNVREESPTGPPVSHVHVSLNGRPFQDAKEDTLGEMTNENGKASFGPIRPGAYSLVIDKAGIPIIYQPAATLYAGQENQMTICIPSPSIMSDISLKLQVPDELKNSPCLVIVDLENRGIKRGDTAWLISTPHRICIDMSGKTRLTGQSAQSPTAMCDILNDKVISNMQWPSVPYKITWMGLYCTTPRTNQPQVAPGMPSLIPPPCVSKIAELVPDKTLEFQPRHDKTEWELTVPDKFVQAYREVMQAPVPVSFQLCREPNVRQFKAGVLLALRFVSESSGATSGPSGTPQKAWMVLLNSWGKITPDSEFRIEAPGRLGWRSNQITSQESISMPLGRYVLDQLFIFQEETLLECTSFGRETLGNVTFNAEPNKLQVWKFELPEKVRNEIEKCTGIAIRQQQQSVRGPVKPATQPQ
jgi:hypothetical protein